VAELVKAIVCVDGVVRVKGVTVGLGGHVVAGAGAADDECACDF